MMTIETVQRGRNVRLGALRRRIERIERGDFGMKSIGMKSIGGARRLQNEDGGEDRAVPFLPGNSETEPALHELVADGYGSQPAARDFGLALVAALEHRHAESHGMVLWCQRQKDALEFGRLYGPGLRDLGLSPDRLLMVTGRRDADCLWAMEQGLASKGLLAVVGMVDRVDLIASRRLSLAARAHGTWCLLLPRQHGREPSAARTRWRIGSTPSTPDALDPKGLGLPSWQLALERSPSGRTGNWTVEWDHATHHFHLAAALGNRPVARRDGPNKEGSSIIAFDRTG